jgi:hypothetical protein
VCLISSHFAVRMALVADGEFRWLRLRKVRYVDSKGISREWEMCERVHKIGQSENNTRHS